MSQNFEKVENDDFWGLNLRGYTYPNELKNYTQLLQGLLKPQVFQSALNSIWNGLSDLRKITIFGFQGTYSQKIFPEGFWPIFYFQPPDHPKIVFLSLLWLQTYQQTIITCFQHPGNTFSEKWFFRFFSGQVLGP